jgi:hypothetical protein
VTTCSVALARRESSIARASASSAVAEPSVPTTTVL